jgi:elongation factor G
VRGQPPCDSVLCGSATKGIGVSFLLETLKDYGASPLDTPHKDSRRKRRSPRTYVADRGAPFAATCGRRFRPAHGRQNIIKFATGTLRKDADLINLDSGQHEKLAHLYSPLGKKQSEVAVAQAGDIVVVSKLKKHHNRKFACGCIQRTTIQARRVPGKPVCRRD